MVAQNDNHARQDIPGVCLCLVWKSRCAHLHISAVVVLMWFCSSESRLVEPWRLLLWWSRPVRHLWDRLCKFWTGILEQKVQFELSKLLYSSRLLLQQVQRRRLESRHSECNEMIFVKTCQSKINLARGLGITIRFCTILDVISNPNLY